MITKSKEYRDSWISYERGNGFSLTQISNGVIIMLTAGILSEGSRKS